jgi:hypothetical protein
MDAIETILDHVDGIRVPGDVFARATTMEGILGPVFNIQRETNEYWALRWLRAGLNQLNAHAMHCEQIMRRRVPPTIDRGGGNKIQLVSDIHLGGPAFDEVPMALLTSSFHWYAISACQYVRLVGAIAHRQDSSRPAPGKYVERVIPEVLAFRNKVAAHFAHTTRNSNDSEAERQASIMPQVSYANDEFVVGALVLTTWGGGPDSRAIKAWGITGIHRRLVQRYWP